MFNRDFYPTPVDVIAEMTSDLNMQECVVYDPESGKGDILKYCRGEGASKLLASEINEDLYKISSQYAQMIGTDFMDIKASDISHVHLIVMNPPFSKDIEHILHAWEIAPQGCIIRALCNTSTLKTSTLKAGRLNKVIDENGIQSELGSCFTNAERTTSVEVALLALEKPSVGGQSHDEWDEYFEYEEESENHAPGLMKHDAVTEIVGRYVGALKKFKEVDQLSGEINSVMSPINTKSISFGCTMLDENRRIVHLGYDDFKSMLQKSSWETVFTKMNMKKYMTESLKERINKFVEEQSDVQFSVKNIYNMLQFVHDTNAGRMGEVLIEVFEKFTQHHNDNRHHLEGWKTNSHYMINEKIIVPWITEVGMSGKMDVNWRGYTDSVDDLVKALCYITASDYDEIGNLRTWCSGTKITDPEWYRNNEGIIHRAKEKYRQLSNHHRFSEKTKKWTEEEYVENSIGYAIERKEHYIQREFGKWYDWGFFEVKGFKKGTMHMKFKDRKVWEMFNRRVAEAKGFELPEVI